MTPKRVLMTMVEAGSGHKVPALAVKEAMERLYPGRFQIDVVDWARASGAHWDDWFMKFAWDFALARPWMGKTVYFLVDLLRPLSRRWVEINFPRFLRKAALFVADYKPDLIFSTQFYCTHVAAVARRRLGLTIPVIGFDTDPFDSFLWWSEPQADFVCVASERARDRLLTRGMRDDQVPILRYPILRKFMLPGKEPSEIRTRYGLNPSMKTMLTTLGGQGIGDVTAYVEDIYRKGLPFNILAVCGKNQAAKERLEKLVGNHPSRTRLVPLGYVGNVEELLAAADFCVAKAGASTTLEALARGAPILFTSFACYNEKPNIDWCLEREVGWYTPDRAAFYDVIRQILETDVLQRYRANIQGLDLPVGADDLAHFLARRLGVQAPNAS